MRKVGAFNDISDQLLKQIKKIGPKQYVELQQIEFKNVQDPETGQRQIIYPNNMYWCKDTITDPYTGNTVEIGVPKTIDQRDQKVTLTEYFDMDNKSSGRFILSGDNVVHREIYEFIQICNFCRDNLLNTYEPKAGEKVQDFHDSKVEQKFFIVDHTKDAKKKNTFYAAKGEVLKYIESEMTEQDIREFCASMNWPHKDPALAGIRIREYADTYPVEFKAAMEDQGMKRRAVIKFALDEGIIAYRPDTAQMMWGNGGGLLAQLEKREDKNPVELLCDWTYATPNGEKIIAQLRRKQPKETA